MKAYLYILECRDKSLYIGSTNNLEERINQHQKGEGSRYTSCRLPIKLVYVEEFHKISDAFYREKQLQGWSKKKKIALIEKRKEDLKQYAACQNSSHFENYHIKNLIGS
jgi:predicted GIY-YIG superfamily endonuclease